MIRWGPFRLQDSQEEIVLALLGVCAAQHRCLDQEDLDGFLVLAEKRDDLQQQLLTSDSVPHGLQADLRVVFREGERLIDRLNGLSQEWQRREARDHAQAQGVRQYALEAETPSQARFLDRRE